MHRAHVDIAAGIAERRRRVVLLTALEGMSYQEVADLLDVPIGTLVCFLSERFEHEVLPATRSRWSLTGWFRSR